MTRQCELTGKTVLFGNNVSHSERKTRRKYKPNLKKIRFLSESLKIFYKFRVSTKAISTVEVKGGLDNYLINAKNSKLSPKAISLKKIVLNKSK